MSLLASRSEHSYALSPPMRLALVLTFLWINVSEVFRYLVFVMPMTRAAMPKVTDAAPMSTSVFLIWAAWDTVLFVCVAVIVWLAFERFGGGRRNVIAAATLAWAAVFCVFWIATWNMNMTVARVPLTALPLAWIEMLVTAALIEWGWRRTAALAGITGRRVEQPVSS